LSARFQDMEIEMTKLREKTNNGWKINAEKTAEMSINSNMEAKITMKGTDIEKVVIDIFVNCICVDTRRQ
jgi:hypothetical protein